MPLVYAQKWQWKTFTSMQAIRFVAVTNTVMWAATEGGMLSYDLTSQSTRKWTNTEGLASNDASVIAAESDSAVWIGYNNGAIQRLDIKTQSFFTVNEYLNREIRCLKVSGDSLLIGLDIGLSLYIISKREVKETYKRLGIAFQVELPVQDIAILDNHIWVATEEGIAIGQLGTENLLDPANWQNITETEGLLNKTITALHVWNNTIFAGTESGLMQFLNDNWVNHLPEGILDIDDDGSHLFALTSASITQYKDNSWNFYTNRNQAGLICFSGQLKIIGSDNGLLFLNAQKQWEPVYINSMQSNRVTTMTVDKNGKLYTGSGSSKSGGEGFSTYAHGLWTNYDRNDIDFINNNDIVSSAVDSENNVWLGTWGDGILVVRSDSTYLHYDESDGTLSSSDPIDPHYPAVTALAADLQGVMWVTVWDSQSNEQLVAVSNDKVTHFGASDHLFANDLICITVDIFNRKWIGSESNGIYVLDDNYTPHDKGDDVIAVVNSADGLESENIQSMAADADGGVYIGTPEGLQYYLNDLSDIQYGLFSNNIKALAIDGVGNVWAGTQGGISYFYDGAWYNFSVDNSPLIDNEILSLAIDKESGHVYAGTRKGISRISTSFIQPEEKPVSLTIYPNPFIPGQHETVQIDGLISDVSLIIVTPSGYLIKKITTIETINGRRAFWDGTDTSGQPVPGGIYLAVMSNADGEQQMGKIALIR